MSAELAHSFSFALCSGFWFGVSKVKNQLNSFWYVGAKYSGSLYCIMGWLPCTLQFYFIFAAVKEGDVCDVALGTNLSHRLSLSPGCTGGYTIGNTVVALVARRKTCSGVSKLRETSCLLHWCRKICSSCFLCLSLTRGHPPPCCAFFSLEGGLDLNLQFKLPFNCFYCMKSGLLIHHYLIGKVVSQQ